MNFGKIIFLTNHMPMTSEGDDAFFSRIEIFEFLHIFQVGVNANANIIKEIATESELSGLLNESVKALQELLKRMNFTASKTVEEKKQYYLIKADPFTYYIDNALDFNNGIEQTCVFNVCIFWKFGAYISMFSLQLYPVKFIILYRMNAE